ncbi:MAG: alanine racemase [Pseudomonadota bacterium]
MPNGPGGPAAARSGAVLTIDLDAIADNYARLRDQQRDGACAAVIKADGYGLGAAQVGERLARAGCDTFFVAHLEEGIALRPVVPAARIYILNGLYAHCAADYTAHALIPVLNDRGQIDDWAGHCRAHGPQPAAVHFDTGMTRLGLTPPEATHLFDDPGILEAFADVLIMSHLACADEPDNALNDLQRQRFNEIRDRLPGHRTCFANSSGLFLGEGFKSDLGRPGIALFGGNPTPDRPNPMRPVVRLEGRILQLREIDAPRTVGYGATHEIAPPARVATIAVGYADGYLRSIGNQGHAYIGEVRVPIVGRVSMDLITVDVTDAPAPLCQPGRWVELLGERHTIDDLAEEAGTIGYEILTSLGARHHRVYQSGDGEREAG